MDRLTPMIRQYREIKSKYPDAILLFRLGDFYEMFNEDAHTASKVLNIALTSRNNMPMCGVPYHAAEGYIKRLLDAGFKVAICEQVEDPSKAKGIVKREVVRVITPGTFIETEEGSREEELIAAVVRERRRGGIAVASISTGQLTVHQGGWEELTDLIDKLKPRTLIHPEGLRLDTEAFTEECDPWMFGYETAREVVKEHFRAEPESLGLRDMELALRALGGLIYYLKNVQLAPVEHLNRVDIFVPRGRMYLDTATLRHLEILENLSQGTTEHTLLEVVDRTHTPMGHRTLKRALLQPLRDKGEIEERLRSVQFLLQQEVGALLRGIGDMERIVSRIQGGMARPRELIGLKEALRRVPQIKARIEGAEVKLLKEVAERLGNFSHTVELIEKSVSEKEGEIIKAGYNRELDRLRELRDNSQEWIARYEERERARTGIPSLKVRYNKVFGYYIEVTKAHLNKVPRDYIRKQTLVNAERFITQELKEVEEEILTASERIEELEKKLYREVLEGIASEAEALRETARAIGLLDFLNSLATVAKERGWVKPEILETGEVVIEEGRHPVVEASLGSGFVPNDTTLNPGEVHIITGPNMSGKSTYIRQVALIVLLAQIGSFVPARRASITPVDRIMTRIGSADNLARGQSTFMVEMTETANILNNATKDSLIILDEIGRGTSTYDGVAIAWATVEYIKDRIRAKTLFATLYHELTQLAHRYPEVKNFRIDVREWRDRVIFTHKLVPGGADKSYGIYVAQIAGLPEEVVRRAKEILHMLESRGEKTSLPLYEHPVITRLRMLNLKKITPLEAVMLLEELKRMAIEEP